MPVRPRKCSLSRAKMSISAPLSVSLHSRPYIFAACSRLCSKLNTNPGLQQANYQLQADINQLATAAFSNCTQEFSSKHSCHQTYSYRYFEGDVNSLKYALQEVDPTSKLCWLDFVNHGIYFSSNVTYYLNKASYWFIPYVCSADDRQLLLKTAGNNACTASGVYSCNASFEDPTCLKMGGGLDSRA